MKVPLLRGGFALIDDEDAHLVEGIGWYGTMINGSGPYVRASGPYTNYSLLHRRVMQAKRGECVDHINRNALDNRKANLRVCTKGQNLCNRPKQSNNAHPYKGVCYRAKKRVWVAEIGGRAKRTYLGTYRTAEEAAAAYDIAAVVRFGEFASLNFPHVFPEVPSAGA